MHNKFTAIIERDGDWYVVYCAEIPSANGQGGTTAECRKSLEEAILIIPRRYCYWSFSLPHFLFAVTATATTTFVRQPGCNPQTGVVERALSEHLGE